MSTRSTKTARRPSITHAWLDGKAPGRVRVPGGFWRWTRKAREHWILKRWAGADTLHNATPPGCPGRIYERLAANSILTNRHGSTRVQLALA